MSTTKQVYLATQIATEPQLFEQVFASRRDKLYLNPAQEDYMEEEIDRARDASMQGTKQHISGDESKGGPKAPDSLFQPSEGNV